MDLYRPQAVVTTPRVDLRAVMQEVYLWMSAGLAVSAVFAVIFASTGLTAVLASRPILMMVMLVELGLVWYLSARIFQMSPATASLLFLVYAAMNGATLSIIFYVADLVDIYLAFFAAGAMFAAMSIVGYTTKVDLSRLRGILLMALIGLIIASIVNIFLASSTLYWLVNYAGVLIFVALTAYDTQWIKRAALHIEAQGIGEGEAVIRQIAIIGSLHLYLDFVNLFLFMLRIMGRRR